MIFFYQSLLLFTLPVADTLFMEYADHLADLGFLLCLLCLLSLFFADEGNSNYKEIISKFNKTPT